MARAFVGNTRWAQLACRVNWSHRRAAGVTAGLLSPELPSQIASAASLHSWPAYRDAMDLLVANTDWERLSNLAIDLDVPVTTSGRILLNSNTSDILLTF